VGFGNPHFQKDRRIAKNGQDASGKGGFLIRPTLGDGGPVGACVPGVGFSMGGGLLV